MATAGEDDRDDHHAEVEALPDPESGGAADCGLVT
jgi:hypothetical protein